MIKAWLLAGVVLLAPAYSFAKAVPATAAFGCPLGAYRAPDGRLLTILRPPPEIGPGLRYATIQGRRGFVDDASSPVICAKGRVTDRPSGEPWRRLRLRETPVTFTSQGVKLTGLLVEPVVKGARPPLLVLVHGSEMTSPIRGSNQYLLAAQGLSVFAYDKRGTAGSEGTYTQDFRLLADDAASAAAAARSTAKGRFSGLGFYGGSQGGWIAPLAAAKVHADFLEVGFGVVGTALEQDQWQVDYQLRTVGTPDSDLPAVHQVTDATARIAASDFKTGFEALAPLRARFGAQPWFAKIDGQFSGLVLKGEIDRARRESPQVPWEFSVEPTLRALKIPQLWVMAADDSVAPSAPSIARLQRLRQGGAKLDLRVFPDTDHGIRRFTVAADGHHIAGDIADGYLQLLANWAKDHAVR